MQNIMSEWMAEENVKEQADTENKRFKSDTAMCTLLFKTRYEKLRG
jgi:hypothetical protein